MSIRLVTRADDAGSCVEANIGIAACCDAGVVRCVSVMAVGPAIEDAAERLAHRTDIAFGLHVSLNAEWEQVTWGPILPPAQVPTLVKEDGRFLPWPADLKARGFAVDEAIAEVGAQLARLRALGFSIRYLDEHCHVSWGSPELAAALEAFGAREGIPRCTTRLRGLPGEGNDFVARVKAASPGDYVLVTHPAKDAPGGMLRRFHLAGSPNDATVARERDAECAALCEPGLADRLRQAGVECVKYGDL